MGRSTKKGPFVAESLMKKIRRARESGKKITDRTFSRSSMVIPDFVGLTIPVHNGKKFIKVSVTEDMVGHRLGEFSPTRFFSGHGAAHSKELEETEE
ncbi:MAG: 30S ribosomal protein S19 [Elusimicrobia bacterium]|jgi:small subunit ribosomal protein S19|nr:30S ribosomal protein S19 [Elusimicrobiota bacterium]